MTEQKGTKKPKVVHNTGNIEWYTPPIYLEAARQVMGGIDCDPASSDFAQRTVQAAAYFTAETNGLGQRWGKRVWMNPPYSRELIGLFCESLAKKFTDGEVEQACVLVNNATETTWFNTLMRPSSAVCLVKGRIKFLDSQGKPKNTPTQGQAVLYLGSNPHRFTAVFSQFGTVLHS
jgi:phage N-6-adenine-methyltransferase